MCDDLQVHIIVPYLPQLVSKIHIRDVDEKLRLFVIPAKLRRHLSLAAFINRLLLIREPLGDTLWGGGTTTTTTTKKCIHYLMKINRKTVEESSLYVLV